LHRADDRLTAWDVKKEGGDPLRWVIILYLGERGKWEEPLRSAARFLAKAWSAANDCEYKKTTYAKNQMRVLVLVKYPSRPSDKEPY